MKTSMRNHKMIAIGAAMIAIIVISQPAQAQSNLIGLLPYPTGTQEFHDNKINTMECANLTNITLLTKLETDTQLLADGTNLQKTTTPPENIWKIKIEPNTTAGAQFSTSGT